MSGPRKWTETLVAERIRNGRGAGEGRDYTPWIYVQEFSSSGNQTRIPSRKLQRTVHTFSYMERDLFFLHEFRDSFLGYIEQVPMDRRVTLAAALRLGIKHPKFPRTSVPMVMTLDAIATHIGPDGRPQSVGWDVKPARKLLDKRVLEKLSLHKAYCAHIGIPHKIFTEQSVPKRVPKNIDWLRGAEYHDGEIVEVPGLFTFHPERMLAELQAKRPNHTVGQYCAQYDAAHSLPAGTGIRIFRMLVGRHLLTVDLTAKDLLATRMPAPASMAPQRKAA